MHIYIYAHRVQRVKEFYNKSTYLLISNWRGGKVLSDECHLNRWLGFLSVTESKKDVEISHASTMIIGVPWWCKTALEPSGHLHDSRCLHFLPTMKCCQSPYKTVLLIFFVSPSDKGVKAFPQHHHMMDGWIPQNHWPKNASVWKCDCMCLKPCVLHPPSCMIDFIVHSYDCIC